MELVNTPLILRKILDLENYYTQIQEYSAITLEEYTASWKTQRIVERTLQMMIETCTDIANHIISDKGLRPPDSYSDTFKVLLENSIINEKLFDTMSKMAKFRNIIVHQYDTIDATIVITILKKHLKDFILFKDAVIHYIQNDAQ
ncbi:MAG: DUF86 domain-containing protein [Spirochaetota bacterium]